ncbi:uncharacterized protein N7473_007581 [Penicillium subrubescens]|uniref:uncharacterized protein n=1 Tax=Penicillium subrubescens TaxID=1316194 RepID=UPI002544DB9F|nr:uncharacterized protein N7473_007581 [Penicillium subrubescens]KAJ5891353.1 hypothetical protein N7473_007581 [Penicillium subrubescens]
MSIAPRSRTAAPLPDETLQLPAMIAVKALLYLRDDLRTLAIHSQNPLSQDARLIIDKCQELQSRLQQPPSCTELEHYALDLYTMLVDSYSREIVLSLSYATRLKLSLIVWHFDASSREPSPELLAFLRSPNDKKVLETIHVRYQDQIRQQVLCPESIRIVNQNSGIANTSSSLREV